MSCCWSLLNNIFRYSLCCVSSCEAIKIKMSSIYWEYKLVRSVFLCSKMNLFQNEWTDQLKNCPSLSITFPISQVIFEFHLEKMTRLWRRSNFGVNFRFLRKKWTGDLPNRAASFETISNQKEQCPEYGGCGKTFHLSVSKYFFTTLATWGRALSWRRTLSCLCSYSDRFSRNARLKRINCSRYRSP